MWKSFSLNKPRTAFHATVGTLSLLFIFEYIISASTIPAFPVIRAYRLILLILGPLTLLLSLRLKKSLIAQWLYLVSFAALKIIEVVKYIPKVSAPDMLLTLFVFSNFISVFVLVFYTSTDSPKMLFLFFAFTIYYEVLYIKKLYDLPHIVLIFIIAFSIAVTVIARLLKAERDRYKQEVELRKEITLMRSRIIEQEKNFSLSMLTSGIAHELGNPINYIKGNLIFIENYFKDLQSILSHAELDQNDLTAVARIYEELEKIFKYSHSGFENIEGVIVNLKSIYGRDKIRKELTNLKTLLLRIIEFFRISHKEEKVTIKAEIDPNINLRIIPGEFYILFSNFLSNSLEAIRVAGRGGVINITAEKTQEYTEIKIVDNGCGIPADKLKKIREPFFTTKTENKHFGLGLAICIEIIDRYAGRLEIFSEENRGTEIILQFTEDINA